MYFVCMCAMLPHQTVQVYRCFIRFVRLLRKHSLWWIYPNQWPSCVDNATWQHTVLRRLKSCGNLYSNRIRSSMRQKSMREMVWKTHRFIMNSKTVERQTQTEFDTFSYIYVKDRREYDATRKTTTTLLDLQHGPFTKKHRFATVPQLYKIYSYVSHGVWTRTEKKICKIELVRYRTPEQPTDRERGSVPIKSAVIWSGFIWQVLRHLLLSSLILSRDSHLVTGLIHFLNRFEERRVLEE
jgi:hypothetical protein